jgi:hypothetical protein
MEDMEKITEDGCCNKQGNMEGICKKPAHEQENSHQDQCPKPTADRNCICICIFQYIAPDQVLISFEHNASSNLSNYNILRDQHWRDPLLAGPWQPPDMN